MWAKTRAFAEQFHRGSKYVELSSSLLPPGWTARSAVSPSSMESKEAEKLPWHADDHKESRHQLIQKIANLLLETVFSDETLRPKIQFQDSNMNPFKRTCIYYERACFYGAFSIDEYKEDRTLLPRIMLLEAIRLLPGPSRGPISTTASSSALVNSKPVTGVNGGGGVDVKSLLYAALRSSNKPIQKVDGVSVGPSPSAFATVGQDKPPAAAGGVALSSMYDDQHKQLAARLTLLFHVKYCAQSDTCGFKQCSEYRSLKPHIDSCRDEKCTVRHCISSRFCIAHYNSCKEERGDRPSTCDICIPAINYQRQVQAIAMAARNVAGTLKRPLDTSDVIEGDKKKQIVTNADGIPLSTSAEGGQERQKLVLLEDITLRLGASPATCLDFLFKKGTDISSADIPKAAVTHKLKKLMPDLNKDMWKEFSEQKRQSVWDHAIVEVRSEIWDMHQQKMALAFPKTAPVAPPPQKKRLDSDCTLVANFTREQIYQHILGLQDDFHGGMPPNFVREQVHALLQRITDCESEVTGSPPTIFNNPVDPIKHNAPDYLKIIKRPMDLGTVKKNLESNQYKTLKSFAEDVRRVFSNAITYNNESHQIHQYALKLNSQFNKWWEKWELQWKKDVTARCADKNNCSLCGGRAYNFEPAIMYCNVCQTRIRKNNYYYTVHGNKHHWCQSCFSGLPKHQDVPVDGKSKVPYKELEKRKNESQEDETWVECTNCSRWQHVICTLFNNKRNEGSTTAHYCPHCLLSHMTYSNQFKPIIKHRKGASALQTTRLSTHIESKVHAMLELKKKEFQADLNTDVAAIPDIIIRLVSNIEKVYLVQPEFVARYGPDTSKNYPTQLLYRSKSIVLFQNLDGAEVLLYCIYVQEFGDDAGCEANRRTAYLSYLDSVRYFEPFSLRTDVYKEILLAYIEDIKNRGFNQITLWSCPPQKGDDYIIHVHPDNQKTPRPEMLRDWYLSLLEEAQRRGIVERVVFLVDDYFPSLSGNENGADREMTSIPYFEGDYIANQCESEAKKIRDAGGDEFLDAKEASDVVDVSITSATRGPSPGTDYTDSQILNDSSNTSLDSSSMNVAVSSAPSFAGDTAHVTFNNFPTSQNNISIDSSTMQLDVSLATESDSTKSKSVETVVVSVAQSKANSNLNNNRGRRKSRATGGGQSSTAGLAAQSSNSDINGAGGISSSKSQFHAALPSIGVDGKPLPKDRLRSQMGANLKAMRTDFIVAKLRPSCQWCKRFLTGAPTLDAKYHCKSCDNLEPNTISESTSSSIPGSKKAPLHSNPAHAKEASKLQQPYDLCVSCFQREQASRDAGQPGMLKHSHPLSAFELRPVEMAPALKAQMQTKQHHQAASSSSASSSFNSTTGSEMSTAPSEPSQSTSSVGTSSLTQMVQSSVPLSSSGISNDFLGFSSEEISRAGISLRQGSHSPDQSIIMETSIVPLSTSVSAPSVLSLIPLVDETVITESDPTIESPFWKSRIAFLSLCQGNHYQFDQLRRAKHSSMMVIYHMHKPHAPSFVHSCNYCSKPIKSGLRFACQTCEEFDICEQCKKDSELGTRQEHEHPLVPFPSTGAGEEQLKNSEDTIILNLLDHACNKCGGCSERSCQSLKKFLAHQTTCADSPPTPVIQTPSVTNLVTFPQLNSSSAFSYESTPTKPSASASSNAIFNSSSTCNICKKLRAFEQRHSKTCRLMGTVCKVPFCNYFKERQRATVGSGLDFRRRAFANALAVGDRPAGDDDKENSGGGGKGEGGNRGDSSGSSASVFPNVVDVASSSEQTSTDTIADPTSLSSNSAETTFSPTPLTSLNDGIVVSDRTEKLLQLEPKIKQYLQTLSENTDDFLIFKPFLDAQMALFEEKQQKRGFTQDREAKVERLFAEYQAIKNAQSKLNEEKQKRAVVVTG